MFNTEDLPLWAYILTVAVGSAMFLHQQKQATEKHHRRLAELEARLLSRLDAIERKIASESEEEENRPRFRLLRR